MIYLFYGTNIDLRRQAVDKLLGSFDLEIFELSELDFSKEKLDEFINSNSLFSKKFVVVLKNILENKDNRELILKNIKALKKSPNIFIFSERDISPVVLKKFEGEAEKIEEFSLKEKPVGSKAFNIFSLADSFAKKDKKNTWLLYQKALSSGVGPEEIYGILSWQVKTLLMVKIISGDPELNKKSGIKPFVYGKALTAVKNFTLEELKGLSSRLTSLQNESRFHNLDFGVELERFILNAF